MYKKYDDDDDDLKSDTVSMNDRSKIQDPAIQKLVDSIQDEFRTIEQTLKAVDQQLLMCKKEQKPQKQRDLREGAQKQLEGLRQKQITNIQGLLKQLQQKANQ